jgi:hypothetical protein
LERGNVIISRYSISFCIVFRPNCKLVYVIILIIRTSFQGAEIFIRNRKINRSTREPSSPGRDAAVGMTISYNEPLPDGLRPFQERIELQPGCSGGVYFKTSQLSNADLKITKNDMFFGICFAFDNINQNLLPKEFSSMAKVRTLNMTSAFAVFNRIPIPVEDLNLDHKPTPTIGLSMNSWLLRDEEWGVIKRDHTMEIKKILSEFLVVFRPVKQTVEKYRQHEYSTLSKQPSKYVGFKLTLKLSNYLY